MYDLDLEKFEGASGMASICVHDVINQWGRNCVGGLLINGKAEHNESEITNIGGVKDGDFFIAGKIDRVNTDN